MPSPQGSSLVWINASELAVVVSLPWIIYIALCRGDGSVAFTNACFYFVVLTACVTGRELPAAHQGNTKSFGLLGSLKQPNIKRELITILLTHLALAHSLSCCYDMLMRVLIESADTEQH